METDGDPPAAGEENGSTGNEALSQPRYAPVFHRKHCYCLT